jgi:inner membrane protein involved in colicin E2 resistance
MAYILCLCVKHNLRGELKNNEVYDNNVFEDVNDITTEYISEKYRQAENRADIVSLNHSIKQLKYIKKKR